MGLRVVTLSYPLKTSLENGTLFGGVPCTVRAGLEVSGIRGAGNDGVLGVGKVPSVRWIGVRERWELSAHLVAQVVHERDGALGVMQRPRGLFGGPRGQCGRRDIR